ncbi:hypothetical protein ACFVYE_42895 [Streptomyces sp. NPDC058239]|uniref:hypothetical protein n=1 Tax=unclassified Streptomyces TaxID=2593676 RepID=UPI00364EFB99
MARPEGVASDTATALNGRSVWRSGSRQVLVGALAAGVSYAVHGDRAPHPPERARAHTGIRLPRRPAARSAKSEES